LIRTVPFPSVEKAIPGFSTTICQNRVPANLTHFLALSELAAFGTTSLCRRQPVCEWAAPPRPLQGLLHVEETVAQGGRVSPMYGEPLTFDDPETASRQRPPRVLPAR